MKKLELPKTKEDAQFFMDITGGDDSQETADLLGLCRASLLLYLHRAKTLLDLSDIVETIDARGVFNDAELAGIRNAQAIREHNARILFWDIETTTIDVMVRQYGLKSYDKFLPWKGLKRDWTILGGAWKFMGEDVRCISVSSKDVFNDELVVRKLHEVISQADILVAHNGDNFDLKKFNARALFYDLPPIVHKNTVDTLKEARKAYSLTSNTLGFLGQFLGIEEAKLESPDWNKILEGDAEELSNMRVYNKMDVILLEKVYYKLRGWMKSHPNITPFSKIKDIQGHDVEVCKNCGSPELERDGYYYMKASGHRKMKFRCKCCGHVNLGKMKKVKNG